MKLLSINSIENAKEFCLENFKDSSPFINYNFFRLLEQSNCTNRLSGWIPNHLLIKEKNQIIGFIPNFKKLNSQGEYIFLIMRLNKPIIKWVLNISQNFCLESLLLL